MADEALLESMRTVIRLARIAHQACEEAGLTLAQYRALNSARTAGRRAFEIAQSTAVSRPAVTSLTNGMIQAGLIAKEASEADGRGVVFVITAHGQERLEAAERILVERSREWLGPAADDLAALSTERLSAALDALADRDFGPRR